jgi:hypothetical protein
MRTGKKRSIHPNSLETLWDCLLSCRPDKILNAFQTLDEEHQTLVLRHLNTIANDAGWHEQQVISALTALGVITNIIKDKNNRK